MRVGIDVPYFDDPAEVRDFVQAAEDIGYHHLAFSEHLVAPADSAFPAGFSIEDPWHESMTFAAYLAGVTSRIELCTSMMLLTLRPTILAAKQAAEVDLLSGGRLRLAVSVGWSAEECRALGVDPSTRGQRIEEQVAALRLLWGEDVATFDGELVHFSDVAIRRRPRRAIPIWMGAGNFASRGRPSLRSLDRVARLADGFKLFAPLGFDIEATRSVIEALHRRVAEVGRPVGSVGVEARLMPNLDDEDAMVETVQTLRAAGATHLGVASRLAQGTVADKIELIRRIADATRAEW